jgi:hypothetical protein
VGCHSVVPWRDVKIVVEGAQREEVRRKLASPLATRAMEVKEIVIVAADLREGQGGGLRHASDRWYRQKRRVIAPREAVLGLKMR